MNDSWPFDVPRNCECFTTPFVLDGQPVLRVYRDYDGAWQFHGSPTDQVDAGNCRLVCLSHVVDMDETLNKISDLQCGWRAERKSRESSWERHKNNPFPSFSDNGYYLEDAVWLSEHLDNLDAPDEKTREGVSVGQHVKLVFRFADERSQRQDGECERMWVLVTGRDDDGDCYSGTIDNDPHHEAAKHGDTVCFHPLHIAAVNAV